MSRIATPKSDAEQGLDLIYTYRYLRAGMVALLGMLVFTVAYQVVVASGCVLGSISAYYFTPARAIFIGALCGLGALLVVHKARSHEEDVLLDFSGVMAIVVALVPTVPDQGCTGSASLPAADVAAAVRNNIWTLVVVLAAAMIARALISKRTGQMGSSRTGGTLVSWICGIILAAELVFFLVKRDSFIALSHGIAAVTMVAGIIAVMVFNALNQPDDERSQRFRNTYYAIAVALGISLAAAVALHLWLPGFRHFILVAELVVIALFIAFWIVQTIELWRKEPQEMREQVERAAPALAVEAGPTGGSPKGEN
jgi:hypothetical protein